MPTFAEIKDLRQAGNLTVAYQKAQEWIAIEPTQVWAKRALAWVLYDLIKIEVANNNWEQFKSNLEELKTLNLEDEMVFNSVSFQIGKFVFSRIKNQQGSVEELFSLFKLIISFPYTKPSKGYSFLLAAFHKAFKDTPKYGFFIEQWDLQNLRKGDFKEETLENGRKMMCIGEQVMIAYSKVLLGGELNEFMEKRVNEQKITTFLPLLDRVIAHYPDLKYPSYYKGQLLLSIGSTECALETFLPFARKNQSQFWVWALLGDFYKNDSSKAIAAYGAAMSCKSPREFFVKVKEKLATILIQQEKYELAKTEIEDIIKLRTANEWKISKRLNDWQKAEWFDKTLTKNNNEQFYKSCRKEAVPFMFPDLKNQIAVIYHVDNNRGIAYYAVDENIRNSFKYRSFFKHLKIGITIQLGLHNEGEENRIITAKCYDGHCDAIKTFEGVLNKNPDKPFGFVNDIFIPPYLAQDLSNRLSVTGKAILSFDAKKQKMNWMAIDIHCQK